MSDQPNDAPEVEHVDLPPEAVEDDSTPYIVNHSGERVPLSEYRDSDEFRFGYVKAE